MSKLFDENDIRPDKLREIEKEHQKIDLDFLHSRQHKYVKVECPACKCTEQIKKFDKHGFEYVECPNCGMLYLSPRPTLEILNEFYPNSANYKFFNDYVFPASKEVRREKIFKPRVEKVINFCKKYNIKMDKLIEIGTGFGIFCEEMAKTKAFKDIAGIEANDALAQTCKEMGFRLFNGMLENLEINEMFDVAVAFEVIEHIFDPESFIKKISTFMKKEGLLVLSFPNYDSFELSILGKYATAVGPTHLNYFTSNSISILLNRMGFKVLEITTPGELDVDIVAKASKEYNIELIPFLKKICIDEKDSLGESFQKFLKENNLSSHMMVVAMKQ